MLILCCTLYSQYTLVLPAPKFIKQQDILAAHIVNLLNL